MVIIVSFVLLWLPSCFMCATICYCGYKRVFSGACRYYRFCECFCICVHGYYHEMKQATIVFFQMFPYRVHVIVILTSYCLITKQSMEVL
jgi:hypothetical protein